VFVFLGLDRLTKYNFSSSLYSSKIFYFLFSVFLKYFFIMYFPQLNFQCYTKSPPYPPPPLPYPPIPTFWPWRSPILGHIKFACPMGLSFQWWPTRPSFDTYIGGTTLWTNQYPGALDSSWARFLTPKWWFTIVYKSNFLRSNAIFCLNTHTHTHM
jgi:hypothetical protein